MKKVFRLSTLCVACISIPLLLMSTSAFAHPHSSSYDNGYDDGYEDAMDKCPCPPWRYLISSFYFGVGLGYEGFQINRTILDNDNRLAKFNTHANGWNGRLMGGYGRFFDNYYLGAEAFVGASDASGKDSIDSFRYDGKVSAGTSLGLSLLPGYKLSSAGPLVYARLGYIDTQFKVKDSIGSMLRSSSTSWTSGFDTGLGVEVPIYNHFTSRLEYEYIRYSSVNNPSFNTIGSDNSPSDNRGSLTFIYRP